eukprot:4159_1
MDYIHICTNKTDILNLIEQYAENQCDPMSRICNTFIGIGLHFTAMSNVRGCKYFSVKSDEEFNDKLNEKFESGGNSCKIENDFGVANDKENSILNTSELI